jgi:hypothetical protein
MYFHNSLLSLNRIKAFLDLAGCRRWNTRYNQGTPFARGAIGIDEAFVR